MAGPAGDSSPRLSRWFSQILRALTVMPQAQPLSPQPGDEEGFAERCQELLDHNGRIIAAAALFFTLVWWPLDLIVFKSLPGAREGQTLWRVGVVALCGSYLLLPLPAWLRRRSFELLVLVGCGGGMIMGYAAGRIGGLDRPNFHLIYPVMLFPLALPLNLTQRIIGTGLFGASILGGLLLVAPREIASPYLGTAISMLVVVLFLSITFGHLFFILSRENFLQAQKLQRNALELRQHNESLESRVAAQTRELRRMLAHAETTRENERTRVARELHDELGQELSALRYALANTRQRYGKDVGSIAGNLRDLSGLLDRTSLSVRAMLATLRPMVLDDLGLTAAVEWLVRRIEQYASLDTALDVQGDDEGLDAEVASMTFRVLQESLTNVVRHAKATFVEVSLRIGADAITLRVRDNGVGFRVEDSSQVGMGLVGMRERVMVLRGELQVDSVLGVGTTVSARLPLPAQGAKAAQGS